MIIVVCVHGMFLGLVKKLYVRMLMQNAHKIRMNAHTVEFACCHAPAIKALNCCDKWRLLVQFYSNME